MCVNPFHFLLFQLLLFWISGDLTIWYHPKLEPKQPRTKAAGRRMVVAEEKVCG